jgi:hypothetical protein
VLLATYNDADGIITTTAQGISSAKDFDAYVLGLFALMEKSKAVHGQWLHIVDARDNLVQPKDSTEHVANSWNDKPRDDGFTAYITGSVLAKMQIQRMRENARKGFFTDTGPARAWLLTQVGASVSATN